MLASPRLASPRIASPRLELGPRYGCQHTQNYDHHHAFDQGESFLRDFAVLRCWSVNIFRIRHHERCQLTLVVAPQRDR